MRKVDRRDFLKAAGQGCFGLAVPSLVFPAQSAARKVQPANGAAFKIPGEIPATSARNLARMIREKKVSSHEVVAAYLKRIEEINPRLNGVVLVCGERALQEAKAADAALARGSIKGPLHGVPMTVADAFDTAGVVSTGGTLGRKYYIPSRDAAAVARLRQAGAIVLAKTNVSELGLSDQTENLLFGRTFNPYHLQRSPGGGYGGAAAIIAAGGSPLDLGSDIAGGLRLPAHFTGTAALKTTRGAVPRTGHIVGFGGLCDPYHQIGPMARWVEDLVLLYPLLVGIDAGDPMGAPVPPNNVEEVDLKKLKAAFYTDNGSEPKATPQTVEAVNKTVQWLSAAGVQVKEDCPKELFKEAQDIRAKYDGADDRAWVRRLLEKHKTKSSHPSLRLDGKVLTAAEFTELAEKIDFSRSKLLQWLAAYDLVICPAAAGPAPLYRDETAAPPEYPKDYGYAAIFNLTGWPVAVVRAAASPEGLPIGVQIAGRPWREDTVLAAARVIEAQSGGWKAPLLAT